jgi:hypothetical protein
LHYARLQSGDCNKFTNTYCEKSSAYDPAVFDQPDGTLFRGYFQSERYFAGIEAEMRRQFQFVPSIAAAADSHMAHLRSRYPRCDVVALHVRRGDYFSKWVRGKFRVMRPRYFHEAAELLPPADRVYLVFSDDRAWCRRKMHRRLWAVEFCHAESHFHELAIMSRCDHFLISPSSFGWWGAWLASNPAKVVVAPRPWFGPKLDPGRCDVAPDRWLRLAG